MTKKDINTLLDTLNKEYFAVHKNYETLFWTSYMGDKTVDEKFKKAKTKLNAFRTDEKRLLEVEQAVAYASLEQKERLSYWIEFFKRWQIPAELRPLYDEVMEIETKIKNLDAQYPYGYKDPVTGDFVPCPKNKLRSLVSVHPDEKVRKSAYQAVQDSAPAFLDEYVQYVQVLNRLAHAVGFEDFYAYKLHMEERMTKKELFSIFDELYEKTKGAFKTIEKELIAKDARLKKPWNFNFLTTGDFEKEEDQYFKFTTAMNVWTKSFANLGVDFRGSKITLDLLERKGKHTNGFCHWPELIRFEGGKRMTGSAGFTCNLIPDVLGSGEQAIHTLFHEGGHAAHYLNSDMKDVCINNEYPPSSTAWAETQSMFMDTIFSSMEWRTRYAKNNKGEAYPLSLFEKKLDRLHVFSPLSMMGIMSVMNFEKEIFETKNLTKQKVLQIAKKTKNKFSVLKVDSASLLHVTHLYSLQSTCSYHGYGLAELALSQWREYFFKKYGYIVDNPNIGKEMTKVWKLGASKSFGECVKLATGKKLSPQAFVRSIMMPKKKVIQTVQQRIKKLSTVKQKNSHEINAVIVLSHGKNKIADNSKGFEAMEKKYNAWLSKQ